MRGRLARGQWDRLRKEGPEPRAPPGWWEADGRLLEQNPSSSLHLDFQLH